MTIKIKNELVIIDIITVVVGLLVFFDRSNVLRIVLGIPALLFFPGYTLVAAMLPKTRSTGAMERVALSVGLSVAAVPLIGLLLSATPWGVTEKSVAAAIMSFVIVMSVVAYLRRWGVPPEEKPAMSVAFSLSGWRRAPPVDRVLYLMLALAVVSALGVSAYAASRPKPGDYFTEFYLLDSYGGTDSYPRSVTVGMEQKVIIGLVSHEKATTSYRVEISIEGIKKKDVGPLVLAPEEKSEQLISFVPDKVGDWQQVDFALYRGGETAPYATLYVRLLVRPRT